MAAGPLGASGSATDAQQGGHSTCPPSLLLAKNKTANHHHYFVTFYISSHSGSTTDAQGRQDGETLSDPRIALSSLDVLPTLVSATFAVKTEGSDSRPINKPLIPGGDAQGDLDPFQNSEDLAFIAEHVEPILSAVRGDARAHPMPRAE